MTKTLTKNREGIVALALSVIDTIEPNTQIDNAAMVRITLKESQGQHATLMLTTSAARKLRNVLDSELDRLMDRTA